MRISAIVLLSCVVLVASKSALNLIPTTELQNIPIVCGTLCLWGAGVQSFPSFRNCSRYIHCIHGFQFELECEPGEEFDHVSLRCQPADESRCALQGSVDSSEETSEEDVSEGTNKTEELEDVTMIAHKNDVCPNNCLWAGVYSFPSFRVCFRYIQCIHGFLFLLDCPTGEEFDHITLRCRPAGEGRCVFQGPIENSSEEKIRTSEDTDERVEVLKKF